MEYYQYEVSISFGVTADSFREAAKSFFTKLVLADWFVNVRHIPSGEEKTFDTANL